MDVGDPLFVLFPDLNHGGGRLLALVIYAYGTITKASDEHISFDLIRGQGCDARARTRREILLKSAEVSRDAESVTYIGAYFGPCVPYADDLYVASNQNQTSTLLPIKDQAGILVA
jgi:hypothetical protein